MSTIIVSCRSHDHTIISSTLKDTVRSTTLLRLKLSHISFLNLLTFFVFLDLYEFLDDLRILSNFIRLFDIFFIINNIVGLLTA